jgi:predicted transcriptional regulator
MLFDSKRSESDIMHEILTYAKDGVRKTRLMHKANMSHNQLNRYLQLLQEYEMIQEKQVGDEGKLYVITEKGTDLLAALQEIHVLFHEERLIWSRVP